MLRGADADPYSGEYYLLFFRPLRDDLVNCAVYTHFNDWSARNPNWEIRQASQISYAALRRLVQAHSDGEARLPVRDRDTLEEASNEVGGAAVSGEMMRRYLPSLLEPIECVKEFATFVPTYNPSDDLVHRTVPTRRLRGAVLKRDGRKCAACGRSPRHHLDLELELHHVLPLREHGPTVAENLLTLCGACHDGLDPDHDPALREIGQLPGPIERSGFDIGGIANNLVNGIVIERSTFRGNRHTNPRSLNSASTVAR